MSIDKQNKQPLPEDKNPQQSGPTVEQLTAMVKHVQADFVNYKKRVERDRKQSIEQANRDLIEQLIPLLDIFDLALKNAEDNETTKGFRMVHDQLIEVLKRQGVEVIDKPGVPLDSKIHEVIGESDKPGPSFVVDVIVQKGYKLFERVIRAAKVKEHRRPGCGSGPVMAREMKKQIEEWERKNKEEKKKKQKSHS